MPKTIVLDIDGCLADFVAGYTQLAVDLGMLDQAYATADQPTWEFGLNGEQNGMLWKEISHRANWWAGLPLLVPDDVVKHISRLSWEHQIVFATARHQGNPHPQTQTTYWLEKHGFTRPNVVCTKYKGELARVLHADYAIDDKVENANCTHWIADSKPCRSYLLDRPYNREGRISKLRVVQSMQAFLADIEEGK